MEEKKQKKRAIDKKSLGLIIGGCFLAAAIIVVVVLAFLLSYNSNAPGQVNIIKLDKTYFSVNSNNNYKGYRFVFTSNEDELVFESEDNVIILEELEGLKAGVTYQIKACYLGETESANSDYSKAVGWRCYLRLQTPEISYDKSGLLSWNAVQNTDYYKLQIISETQIFTVDTTETSYDLNNIDGGQLKIFLSARSNSAYIEQSPLTGALSVDFYKTFKDFEYVSIDLSNNNLLTIKGSQLIKSIDILINDVCYVGKPVTANVSNNDEYIYYVSLIDYKINKDSVVIVSPSNIDTYNTYSGDGVQAVFE